MEGCLHVLGLKGAAQPGCGVVLRQTISPPLIPLPIIWPSIHSIWTVFWMTNRLPHNREHFMLAG